MERLTKWEGINPDGTPHAVLAKRDGNWNDNIQDALRRLAELEDLEEAAEASALAFLTRANLKKMHERAEADRQLSICGQMGDES